jgi:hypothetical protein
MFPIWKHFFPKFIHPLSVLNSETTYSLNSVQMYLMYLTMIILFPNGNKMETNFSPDDKNMVITNRLLLLPYMLMCLYLILG